jgi:hypothetical protein
MDGSEHCTADQSPPGTFEGMIQLSFALAAPRNPRGERGARPIFTEKMHNKVVKALERQFEVPGSGIWSVCNLNEAMCRAKAERNWEKPALSWIGPQSTHRGYPIDSVFEKPGQVSTQVPGALRWTQNPSTPIWKTMLSAQKVDGNHGHDVFDYTDHLVRRKATCWKELESLRLFVAQLYARRRDMIFSENLSDRIYHVWLPPAVLTNSHESRSSKLALLPFVTLTRRPYAHQWRRCSALSFVVVPVGERTTEPRPWAGGEIARIVSAVRGSANDIELRNDGVPYQMKGPLYDYLNALRDDRKRPVTRNAWDRAEDLGATRENGTRPTSARSPDRPAGLLRQWIELTFVAVAEGRGRHDKGFLVDEVLRSLRTTAAWAVLTLTTNIGLEPDPPPTGCTAGNQPGEIFTSPPLRELLYWLWTWSDPSTPKTKKPPMPPGANINDGEGRETEYAMVKVPTRRGVMIAYDKSKETFPGPSSLNLFGVVGHMVLGVSCATEIVSVLGRDILAERRPGPLAREAYDTVLELEEVFDLEIHRVDYLLKWRQFRDSLGIVEAYRLVRDRLDVLARFADVEAERERYWVTIAIAAVAAFVGLVAIVLTLLELKSGFRLTTGIRLTVLFVGIGVLAALAWIIGALFLKRRRRRHRAPWI